MEELTQINTFFTPFPPFTIEQIYVVVVGLKSIHHNYFTGVSKMLSFLMVDDAFA